MIPADIEALTRTIARCDEPGLVAAWLFGSRARDDAREDSDVDVALLYATRPPSTLTALPEALARTIEQAHGAEADLVVLNNAPPDLVHRVLRDGVLLLDRDPATRVRFEVRSRNAYFDLLPTLRRYRRVPASLKSPAPEEGRS